MVGMRRKGAGVGAGFKRKKVGEKRDFTVNSFPKFPGLKGQGKTDFDDELWNYKNENSYFSSPVKSTELCPSSHNWSLSGARMLLTAIYDHLHPACKSSIHLHFLQLCWWRIFMRSACGLRWRLLPRCTKRNTVHHGAWLCSQLWRRLTLHC